MPPPPVVTVGHLLRGRADAYGLGLELLAGATGLDREISSPYIQKTGLALAGYHEYLRPGRVLIYGDSEIRYLQSLGAEARLSVLTKSFEAGVPCVLATTDLPLPSEVAAAADHAGVGNRVVRRAKRSRRQQGFPRRQAAHRTVDAGRLQALARRERRQHGR